MMNAITVKPQWAYAFIHLGKRVENRSFFPESLLGRMIALHAGKHVGGSPSQPATFRGFRDLSVCMTREGYLASPVWMKGSEPFLAYVDKDEVEIAKSARIVMADDCPASVVFAVARIGVAHQDERDGWWLDTEYQWKLDRYWALKKPVPCKGQQGVWKLPEEVEGAVAIQIDRS